MLYKETDKQDEIVKSCPNCEYFGFVHGVCIYCDPTLSKFKPKFKPKPKETEAEKPQIQLCPLRKTKTVARHERAWDKIQAAYVDTLTPAEWKEEFLPCLGEKCGWWEPENGKCSVFVIADMFFSIVADGLNVKSWTRG